jgi:heme exporter protein D
MLRMEATMFGIVGYRSQCGLYAVYVGFKVALCCFSLVKIRIPKNRLRKHGIFGTLKNRMREQRVCGVLLK